MDLKKALERQTFTGGEIERAARSDDLASLHRAAVESYADEVATLRKHISGAIDGQDLRSHYEKLMQDDPRRLLPADLSRFDGTLRADADRVGMTSGYEAPNYVDATAERMLKSMAQEEKIAALYSISEEEIKAAEERGRNPVQPRSIDVIRNPALEQMARDHSRNQERENAKVELARRSAEASEAALAAERQRTADAREEARVARRNTRIALWFAGASVVLAAWPFIKDQF